MSRMMSMTLKAVGPVRATAMAHAHSVGLEAMRRAVGFAIVASGFAVIAAQGFAQLMGH
jgi:hypothetical protein